MDHDTSFLGEFEQIVLLAILQAGDGAYAVPIREEIARRTGRSVSRGALYTTLERLEIKGLVASRLADPTPQRGGRAKRLVAVTPRGVRALRASRRSLLELWRGLDTLLGEPS